MRWAIWNNPLVATSFLLRARRSGLFTSVVLYLLFWGMAGMSWWYYVEVERPDLGKPPDMPVRIFFLALLSVQTGLAAIVGGLRAAAAMKNEVLSKTLDFQRIASVSPWDIMLGKLFGEPAAAYLLTIATVPVAVFCAVLGIQGIGPLEVFLIYVSILTTGLMFGAMSLQHRLNIPSEKSSGAVPGFGSVVGVVSAASGLLASAAGGAGFGWVKTPWAVALIGLFTPIPIFWGIGVGDSWAPGLYLFSREFKIPFLLVTPVTQTAMALLCVHIMARRLMNPATPTLSKPIAYLLLFIIDFLAVGVIQASDTPLHRFKLAQREVVFCAIHIITSFIVIGCVTPNRELLETWAWRWRGKKPWLLDEWLGERSLNTLALVTCCLIGALGIGALLLMAGDPQEPILAQNDWFVVLDKSLAGEEVRDATQVIPLVLALTSLIVLTFGSIYQWMVTVANKYGSSMFILLLFVAVALPAVAGAITEGQRAQRVQGPMNIWLELSPVIHYIAWGGAPLGMPNLTWIALIYSACFVLTLLGTRRRLGRIVRRVEAKLETMGVRATTPRPLAEAAVP